MNAPRESENNHVCPVQSTINVISGKWKVQILWHLSFGPMRFAEIRDLLRDISEKVLTDQLRQLAADGVVHRQVSHSGLQAVSYSLTEDGEKLIPTMQMLCDWGSAHFGLKPSLPSRSAHH
jgi:DNA-binding HxlR family transcriptional regulator